MKIPIDLLKVGIPEIPWVYENVVVPMGNPQTPWQVYCWACNITQHNLTDRNRRIASWINAVLKHRGSPFANVPGNGLVPTTTVFVGHKSLNRESLRPASEVIGIPAYMIQEIRFDTPVGREFQRVNNLTDAEVFRACVGLGIDPCLRVLEGAINDPETQGTALRILSGSEGADVPNTIPKGGFERLPQNSGDPGLPIRLKTIQALQGKQVRGKRK